MQQSLQTENEGEKAKNSTKSKMSEQQMMSIQIITRTRCMFFINVMLNNFGTVECKLQTFESYKKKKQQRRNWIENLYFNEGTFKFPLTIKHSICATARTPNNDYQL